MSELAVERFFSVAAELTDGTRTQVKVRGDTPGGAFQQVRGRSDVRRVGKVTEIDGRSFASDDVELPPPVPTRPGPSRPGPSRQSQAYVGDAPREALIGFTISGPRVVRDALAGGERPFKVLKGLAGPDTALLPSEPIKPAFSPFGPAKGPVANDPSRPAIFAKPAPAAVPAHSPTAPATPGIDGADVADAPETSTSPEYRIVKSRRQSGQPYLLQRGLWSQQKGKRVFTANWEKGFDTRPAAEKHQAWLLEAAAETESLSGADHD